MTVKRKKRDASIIQSMITINPPILPGGLFTHNPTRVTIDSPLPLRRAVYRLACYFRREFHYDFIQYEYEGRETDPKHVAFLWPCENARHCCGNDTFTIPAIGACCFRWRKYIHEETSEKYEGYALQWIWLHPFCRRQRLLSDAWPQFREQLGDFLVEPPYSDAMEAFLIDRAESHGDAPGYQLSGRYSDES